MSGSSWSALLSIVAAIVVATASFLQWWDIGFDGRMVSKRWVRFMWAGVIVILIAAGLVLIITEA